MVCMACGSQILRRYFTHEFQGKEVLLCPACNKHWDGIKAKLEEAEKVISADMAKVKQVNAEVNVSGEDPQGVEK